MSTPTVFVGTACTSTCYFYVPPDTTTSLDPTTVTLKFGPQGAQPTTWVYNGTGSITRAVDSNSNPYYFAEILGSIPGFWITQWIGTGSCAVVNFSDFTVKSSPF